MKTILVIVVLVLMCALWLSASPSLAQEPAYSIEWVQSRQWESSSWVEIKVTSPTDSLDEIYRVVMYLEVPNFTESKWVFDQLFFYEDGDNTVQFLSALYPTPSKCYALNACVWDYSGGIYCVPEKLVPDCTIYEQKVYIPSVFK